ncbi:MAG: 2-hydroxyacid dehydrogenase, partial [Bacteroidota bacterium]
MKVAVFSTKKYDEDYFKAHNSNNDIEFVFFEATLSKSTAQLANGFEAICIFVNDKGDREVLEILYDGGVRFIALRCAGFNNIDLDTAKKLGIEVTRVPAYSPEAVAEHAVALILTLNRKTHKAYNRVREGNFSLEKLTGFNLAEKTVGVIGTGKIGAAFCKIMQGFSCKVIAYDKFPNEELAQNGITYVSLEEVMVMADIISLHCPLNNETKHIINQYMIEKMKDGVMIINTSRGGLVNT